ncbi:helix-turn-helix domain-containing protein [Streptomyces sp. NPDC051243]|uniref:helix-turn-helix domain-containing protein n=1 Tax=Streptomyces sp. NPDC051243 TaxID=3365646 RepID=UPI0037A8E840
MSSQKFLTTVEALERDAILRGLADHKSNVQRTAQDLGISRATRYRKMRCYGIVPSPGDDVQAGAVRVGVVGTRGVAGQVGGRFPRREGAVGRFPGRVDHRLVHGQAGGRPLQVLHRPLTGIGVVRLLQFLRFGLVLQRPVTVGRA